MKQPLLHPAILDIHSDLRHARITRRTFLRYATLLGASATTAYALAACSPQSAPASLQPVLPTPSPVRTIKRGGTIKIGSRIAREVNHPARLEWLETANQLRQVAEYLTETQPDNTTRPWLLERWETDTDVKTWTLHLRRGITFNNGDPLTADDVIFTFEQWLNPAVKSSMLDLLFYLRPSNIERVDDYTIRLHLDEPQIGVPEHLFHYPALILPRRFEGSFLRQPIGTGPFLLDEYRPGERVVLKRRDDYWRLGADNQPLPYLDEIIYLDYEPEERVAAMQGGLLDSLLQPRPADWQALHAVPDINVFSVNTAQAIVLRMRVDRSPWDDVRVRTALKLCQNRERILQISFFGQGLPGIDAHVAPVHPAYCPKPIPAYNPDQSRALLAAAGYPNGIRVTLTAKNDQGEPDLARAIKELAEPGGFYIELNIVEPLYYWDNWKEVDLGLTPWAHRSLDTMVLALGYTADADGNPAQWNETRWVDEEFTALLRQAERTLDIPARQAIMCKIEDIMQERGPIGISYWRNAWTIVHSAFYNIQANPSNYDMLYAVWKDKA